MKVPENFNKRIGGYILYLDEIDYTLGYSVVSASKELWITPNQNARNVIMIEFNWDKECYVVNVVRSGLSRNFHATSLAIGFDKDEFRTFASFRKWLCSVLPHWREHFEFK